MEKTKKRVHVVAMGDVGSTLAMGLVLEGGDCISHLGVYDVRPEMMQRCAFELNQVMWPFDVEALPQVETLCEENLFACDVFVFCASAGVPPVGTAVEDVRMAQLAGNARILTHYAQSARRAAFCGLFAVVSDPVDLLCQCAYYKSNQNEAGVFDGLGLRPGQIRGYGLGVMHARAAYYAKRDARFQSYLQAGRAFGPHGQDLIIANSILEDVYDDALSIELTALAVQANREMRALGFKPYIAPALSSGAISLLLTLRGQWHYSAVYQDGVYFGCKNRQVSEEVQVETMALPAALQARIAAVKDRLWEEGAQWRSS